MGKNCIANEPTLYDSGLDASLVLSVNQKRENREGENA